MENTKVQIKTKGQRSREKIITTSIECFFKKGFEATSTQEIADLCGVSQTTIFYHFKNKKVLFNEILKFVISNNRSIFEKQNMNEACPFDKLKSLLRSNIEWGHLYPEQTGVLLQLFSFAATDANTRELATQTIDKGRSLVYELLEEIESEKNIQLNKTFLSAAIQQYVNAVLFQMLARTDKQVVYDSFHLNLDSFLRKLIFN